MSSDERQFRYAVLRFADAHPELQEHLHPILANPSALMTLHLAKNQGFQCISETIGALMNVLREDKTT